MHLNTETTRSNESSGVGPNNQIGKNAIAYRRGHCVLMLLICLFLVYGAHVVHKYKPFTYAYADPGWMVSTVMSIVEDRDLDLRNQLRNDPNQAADQTSQGKGGQWYPLHEFLMPVLTVPFYLAFGIDGCLVFNVLISIALMMLLFDLCARHVDYPSAFAATVLTAFPTLFLEYTYSYSLDVFSAFMLILAYWCAVNKKFFIAGFVWGLAIFSRFSDVVTLIGLIPFLFLERDMGKRVSSISSCIGRVRPLLLSLAGALPVACCILLSNWLMFGSAFVTSYDRWQHFVDGTAIVSTQRSAFSGAIIDRLPTVLTDPKTGLLIGGPLILVAAAFGTRPFWRKARNEMIMAVLVSAALLVLFCMYRNAVPGALGNRYLMPVVALSAIPLAFAIQNCFANAGSAGDRP
jgi:hypothetical protein